MRGPRLPIGALLLAVALAALICLEVRAFLDYSDRSASIDSQFFGPTLLAGANLLLVLGLLRLPRLGRTGRLTGSFWFGFQGAGWVGLLLLMATGLVFNDDIFLKPPLNPVLTATRSCVGQAIGLWPASERSDRVVALVFSSFHAVLFGAPLLLVALLGGLIVRALGVEVEIRVRRRRGVGSIRSAER